METLIINIFLSAAGLHLQFKDFKRTEIVVAKTVLQLKQIPEPVLIQLSSR